MRNFKVICLLILATFAVYAPSLMNGFVWDDTALVLRDPLIRSWRLIPEGFRHFLFTDATASNFYRPIQRLTFTFDYALWGFAPLFYHLTNILLHAFAAVALFLFVFELTKKRLIATLVALIWAVHPISSSAVIYVAGRADLLAALFGFGALWLALRDRKGLAAGSFFLALLSKESAFAFILIWVLILLWQRRFQLLPRWGLLLAAVVLAYCLLRFGAEHTEPPRFTEPAPLIARPILMARAVALYTGLYLVPANLHMERDLIGLLPFTSVEQARELEFLTLAGIGLIVGLGVGMRRTHEPLVRLCMGCALIAYLPISNVFPLNSTFAEHWFYVPSAFALVAAALALSSVRGGSRHSVRDGCQAAEGADEAGSPGSHWISHRARSDAIHHAWAVLLACWIAFISARTFVRNGDWKDARTFFTRTIADGGETSRMWTNLGSLELSEGKPKEALVCFQKAMTDPQPFALLGIVAAEIKLGDYQSARTHLDQALKIPFVRPEALQSLAVLEYRQSKKDRIDLLWEAANLAPQNWGVQKKYLLHLAERGQGNVAIEELWTLLETQAYRGESWRMLGDLLLKEGRRELAASAYEQSALLDVHSNPPKL